MLADGICLALSDDECQRRYTELVPIYEYRCANGHLFDVMQRMSDDPLTACIECGAAVQKVLNAPAIHFKGSGFYNTDYGKRKRGASAKEDGAAPKSDTAKSESKTDSKPADSKPAASSSSSD